MKRKLTKLTLNRETLKALQTDALQAVHGGETANTCTCIAGCYRTALTCPSCSPCPNEN